jgi:hypothetical protein
MISLRQYVVKRTNKPRLKLWKALTFKGWVEKKLEVTKRESG